ncbi:MAG: CYTH domain-containing protein, partial [Anaerolineae bacterium]
MEVEAKFVVPDAETLRELQALPRLGEYTISGEDRRRVLDTYLDTADRRIWQAGYAFRRRKWGEGVLLTL